MEQVAILGLGIIGSRVAKNVARAGWAVKAWNRTWKPEFEELAAAGISLEESPAAAVEGARWVSLYVRDSVAVREVFEAIREKLTAAQCVINHATIDLETSQWLAGECAKVGCGFLDVPFTGSREAAAGGKLVYYLSGDEALLAASREYLQLSSQSMISCGKLGNATIVKLATNLISACTVQALSEALAIVQRHGIVAEEFVQAVAHNACASTLSGMKLPTMVEGNFDTHFSLKNMEKDSRYVRELAQQVGVETPAIDAVSARMKQLCEERGLGELDYSALSKGYERE